MTEEKQNMKWDTMLYINRTLTKESVEGAPKQWKLYMLNVKMKLDDQYERKYSVFAPLTSDKSIALDDMKENTLYELGYFEKPYDNKHTGGTSIGKQVIVIKEAKEGAVSKISDTATQSTSTTKSPETAQKGLTIPTNDDIDKFTKEYKEMLNDKAPNFNQYLAVMLRTKYAEELKEFIDLIEKKFTEAFPEEIK